MIEVIGGLRKCLLKGLKKKAIWARVKSVGNR